MTKLRHQRRLYSKKLWQSSLLRRRKVIPRERVWMDLTKCIAYSVRPQIRSRRDQQLIPGTATETMTSLLGTLGYSLLKISFLKFLRRLSSKLLQDVDAGKRSLLQSHMGTALIDEFPSAFVTSSALLAHEYLLLGKTIRAGTILAQAEQRTQSASKAGTTLSPAVEVLRLLSHAEYFAVLGNHDRA